MAHGSDPIQGRLNSVLESVRVALDEVVRLDHLTGLGNVRGLDDRLEELISSQQVFWAAFVEIDWFKGVNDDFGYDLANGLLVRVATEVEAAASRSPTDAWAFRAHGDEFYLLGVSDATTLGGLPELLEDLRRRIAEVAIEVRGKPKVMSCTVSIGWLAVAESAAVSRSQVRSELELAVSVAKSQGRNQVVPFADDMTKIATREYRKECSTCGSKFKVDVQVDDPRTEDLYCPNCGGRVVR